jgi:hypothetical protein
MEDDRQDIPIRTLYRIVWDDPPTESDFLSYLEMGRDPGKDPEWNRLASGLSVYSDLAYARKKAARLPWKSNCFIAEIRLPEGHPFTIEQTGPNGKHYTVWGDGEVLRSMISRILPARQGDTDV